MAMPALSHALAARVPKHPAARFVAANGPAHRLVVFVHGFLGRATKTWGAFPAGDATPWWAQSDLLFFGYDSVMRDFQYTAADLRSLIDDVAAPGAPVLAGLSMPPGRATFGGYDEVVLVGHSLGGVVLRQTVLDAAKVPETSAWIGAAPRLRLFSPAIGGVTRGGPLRLGIESLWSFAKFAIVWSATLSALVSRDGNLPSPLSDLRDYTQGTLPQLPPHTAETLWAEPDQVVRVLTYSADPPLNKSPGTDHTTVCKPGAQYREPWKFVQEGRST